MSRYTNGPVGPLCCDARTEARLVTVPLGAGSHLSAFDAIHNPALEPVEISSGARGPILAGVLDDGLAGWPCDHHAVEAVVVDVELDDLDLGIRREHVGLHDLQLVHEPDGCGGTRVAALYVQRGGIYYGLEGVEPWDEERDARTYAGPWPVVAHPPCNRGKRRSLFDRMLRHEITPERYTAIWKRYFRMFPNGPWKKA